MEAPPLNDIDPLEVLWGEILSRQPQQIWHSYSRLSSADQKAVLNHLDRMVSEPGWHAEQRTSARVALEILTQLID